MASRPGTIPQLDTNQTNRTIPAGSKVTDGYVATNSLPAASLNYLHGWAGDWLEWLQERSEDGATPGTDLTLVGLDALTVTADGGVVTIKGGDGGGTSGDGGDIILLPGSVTSGTQGYVGIGTSSPRTLVETLGVDPSAALYTSSTTGYAEYRIGTDDSGTIKGVWDIGVIGSADAGAPGSFYLSHRIDASGASVTDPAIVILDDGSMELYNGVSVTGGLSVGSSPPAVLADAIRIGHVNFELSWNGTDPRIEFDAADAIEYDRLNDTWIFRVGSVTEWAFSDVTLDCQGNTITNVSTITSGGLSVGSSPPAVTADAIRIGHVNFELSWNGTDPRIEFDTSDDSIEYDRSEDKWIWRVGSVTEWEFGATELDCNSNNLVDVGTITSDAVVAAATGAAATGITGTGGASDGVGVTGTGGATNGRGVAGTGTGSGEGVYGTSSGGQGVHGHTTNAGSAGVRGDGASGNTYGVSAYGQATTPARAALFISPQSADPSVPLTGAIYVNSGDGTLRVYNGSAWKVVAYV